MSAKPCWPNVESAEQLAERLEHLDKRITSPGENAILGAAAAKLREQARRLSDETKRAEGYKRRLAAMFPLFEEARDALTAIPLASAKLRGIDLNLADRMDAVGDPQRWASLDALPEAP